jgi:hypothetical protein
MPQSLFVFASSPGARIRALGFRPDRPARGRGCPGFAGSASLREPCGLGLALSRTGGVA